MSRALRQGAQGSRKERGPRVEQKAPDLIEQVMDFIDDYRAHGGDAWVMQRTVEAAFPTCSGGTYAIALMRANRRRDGRA